MWEWPQRLTTYVLDEVQGARLARWAHRLSQILYHVARKSWEDQCIRRAAALSFVTLLNLFPLAGLVLFFLSHSTLFQNNLKAAEEALVDQIMTPAAQQVILDLFESLSKNLSVLGKGASGVIALGVLLFLGTSLISSVDKALNEIWRGPSRAGGAFLARVSLLWMGVTLLPIAVASSFALSTHFKRGMPRFYLTAHYVLPYVITFAAFLGLYWFTPRLRLSFKATLIAALLGAALWEGAKLGLSAYVRLIVTESTVQKLYGSLALVPIGMIWIDYSWLIVLLGAELAYVIHHREALQSDAKLKLALGRGFTPLSRKTAVALLLKVFDSFDAQGGPVYPLVLASTYHFHPDQVNQWFAIMEGAGWIAQTPSGGYLAARPASAILVREVVERYEHRFHASLLGATGRIALWAAEEDRSFLDAVGDRTLASLTPEP